MRKNRGDGNDDDNSMGVSIEFEQDEKHQNDNNCDTMNRDDSQDDVGSIGNKESDGEVMTQKAKSKITEEEAKPKRPISFAAIPSFHDQDLARIGMIHKDLLNTSQLELTRNRYSEANNEYKKGKFLKTSIGIYGIIH